MAAKPTIAVMLSGKGSEKDESSSSSSSEKETAISKGWQAQKDDDPVAGAAAFQKLYDLCAMAHDSEDKDY